MFVTKNGNLPIKYWLKDLPEQGAVDQAENLGDLPFAFRHIAIMPDTHQGYGMPIGGVMATKDVIVPNAVGVDIGCGMCAVKTSLTELDQDTLKKIMGEIRKVVPVGFAHHEERQDEKFMPGWAGGEYPIIHNEQYPAKKQLGTLGGGNHFIEIQKGDDGHIWIMIHSGSRNLGYKVANHYNELAKELNKKWHTAVDPKWELAFLPTDSEEGQDYIREMQYCVEFALANRKLMMNRVCEVFRDAFENSGVQEDGGIDVRPGIVFSDLINIAHNYASLENHFGKNVWVHRKGATLAREGTIGIIPGSQGTKSYIVEGLGNPESFMSCSHGAGRTMSRKKAREELDLETEKKRLDDLGVIHSIRNKKDLDEASSAYKDINEVMDNQKDLVNVLVELTPLAVIKG